MIIQFNDKRYYLFEEKPGPPPDLYGVDMWGYINSHSENINYKVNKLTRVGTPRPPRKLKVYTPEEAADKLASIKPREYPIISSYTQTSCSTLSHTCGITGCSNANCEPCTTSFYGNIGV